MIESYLVGKRDSSLELQFKSINRKVKELAAAGGSGSGSSSVSRRDGRSDYYKDRGRQPNR
jgi:hypothetical protein